MRKVSRIVLVVASGLSCVVLAGCPLSLDDPYVTADPQAPQEQFTDAGPGLVGEDGSVPDGGHLAEAAVREASSPDVVADEAGAGLSEAGDTGGAGGGGGVEAEGGGTGGSAPQGSNDAGEQVEPQQDGGPTCGKPCGKGCESLCEVGEPCHDKHDCVAGSKCKKDDSDEKVCTD